MNPTVPRSTLPGPTTMVRRALVLKCPHCGSRRTFIRRWVLRHDRCRTCGIRWHREHGFELGPIALNVVFTFALLAIGMTVAFIATAPDIPVGSLVVAFLIVAVVLPVVLFPFSNTLWLAFDLVAHKPDQRELLEAAASVEA